MILIKNGHIITMDKDRNVYPKGAIVINGTKIIEVGNSIEIEKKYLDAEIIDAKGQIIIPGLINAHTHIYQVMYKGLGDDSSLLDWLERCIWPMSRELTGQDCYNATMLAGLEMIKGGTTTYVDCHYINKHFDCQDNIARATEEIGIRGILGRCTIDSSPAPAEFLETIDVAQKECSRIIETYNGALDGRLSVRVEPLNESLASPEMIKAMSDVAVHYGVGMNMHIAEAKARVEMTVNKFGKTPIEMVNDLGVLGPNVLLAHCCWLSDKDIEIIKSTDTKIAHNPVSNQYLADGVAPVPRMLKKGITVTLGSDGACSNNNHNMFTVMKSAALLHKVHNLDSEAITAEQVFEMATINAAKAIGKESEIGSLETGKYADILLIDQNHPCMIPSFRAMSNLVYAANPDVVNTVFIHGKMVMKDKIVLTVDEEKVLDEVNKSAWDLARRSNLLGATDQVLL